MFKNLTSLGQKTAIGIAFITIAIVSPPALAAQDPLKASAVAAVSVSNQDLVQDISLGIVRVPEFLFIQQEAQSMGVKAYLFGGTASSFAHYVRWDIMRLKGDKRLLEDRFGYDMVDIFRNNQDFDIVLDGTPEQVQKLQGLLDQKFPHMQGAKSAWEVRSLRHTIGTKAPLLGNPDFLNQHTDSNSTGMIDLTAGSAEVIKDLRDWNNPRSQFLQDLLEGKIHFYYSDKHDSTEMARQGNNPAIVSVVRLLVKALQFDLELRSEDIPAIQKIINAFKPKQIKGNSYAQRRLAETALKLVQNSVNLERSMTLLDQLEIRKKLIEVAQNQGAAETAQLLDKEPLRTKTLGTGVGKTAQELGLSTVSHDTRNLDAYYSILRSPTGEPNVFISRNGIGGEVAAHGDGFYVRSGTTGAVANGLTIRFKLNPSAREGSDFKYLPNHDGYLVILNKKALQVIPELAKMTLPEMANHYLHNQFDAKDRAAKDKLLKKIKSQLLSNSLLEIEEYRAIIINNQSLPQFVDLLTVCSKTPQCWDDRIQKILNAELAKTERRQIIIADLTAMPSQSINNNPQLAEQFLEAFKDPSGRTITVLSKASVFIQTNDRKSHLEVLKKLFTTDKVWAINALKKIDLTNYPEINDFVINSHDTELTYKYVVGNPVAQLPVLSRLANGYPNEALKLLAKIDLKNRPDLLPLMISLNTLSTNEKNMVQRYFVQNDFSVQLQLAEAAANSSPSTAAKMLSSIPLNGQKELLPVIMKIAANGYYRDGYQVVKDFALKCDPNTQVRIIETATANNIYWGNSLISEIKNLNMLPALLQVIKGMDFTLNGAMNSFRDFSAAHPNHPQVQVQIAEAFLKRDPTLLGAYLAVIDTQNRPDLLPVLVNFINKDKFDSQDFNHVVKFSNANPNLQVQIATAFANKHPTYAITYLSTLSLKNRPDFVPVLLRIFENSSLSKGEIDLVIAFGKSNSAADAKQIESALRQKSTRNADIFSAGIAAPGFTNQKQSPVGITVLKDLPNNINGLQKDKSAASRINMANYLKDYDASIQLTYLLANEIRNDAKPEVIKSILLALQKNGDRATMESMISLESEFKKQFTSGLKNRVLRTFGLSQEKTLSELWDQTIEKLKTNNVINEKNLVQASVAAPVCTKIFGN